MVPDDVWRRVEYERNPNCRAEQHEPWDIKPLRPEASRWTAEAALRMGSADRQVHDDVVLEVPGQSFHVSLSCSGCARDVPVFGLYRRREAQWPPCPDCGGTRFVAGDDLREELGAGVLGEQGLALTLTELGLRPQEVFRVTRGQTRQHFELAPDPVGPWPPASWKGEAK